MKVKYLLLACFIGFFACANSGEKLDKDTPLENASTQLFHVKEYQDSLALKDLLNSLRTSFEKPLQNEVYSFPYFLEQYQSEDSCLFQIQENWTYIHLLHLLFTSEGAYNCARGPVGNIPYFWHWVSDNPRHQIKFTQNQKLLKETKAPAPFGRYSSYADIDRTPELYLSDYFSKEARYYNPCDTFYTFGWCSEREMAFVALLSVLDMEAKVVAEGNHSWTELCLKTDQKKDKKYYLFQVDNTFNSVGHQIIDFKTYEAWKTDLGDSKIEKWYNQKALDTIAHQKIAALDIDPKRSTEIYQSLKSYFERNY